MGLARELCRLTEAWVERREVGDREQRAIERRRKEAFSRAIPKGN